MKDETKALDASRRDFLKKAGRIAVYVPPAMLVLSKPSFEAIAQSAGTGNDTPPSSGGVDLEAWLRDLLRRLIDLLNP